MKLANPTLSGNINKDMFIKPAKFKPLENAQKLEFLPTKVVEPKEAQKMSDAIIKTAPAEVVTVENKAPLESTAKLMNEAKGIKTIFTDMGNILKNRIVQIGGAIMGITIIILAYKVISGKTSKTKNKKRIV